jgi:D-alanine transaminase
MAAPMSEAALGVVLREVVRRNGIADGIVYLQVSRGVAPRDFAFPAAVRPSLVVTARRKQLGDPRALAQGVRVITMPDIRWGRPDIKTVSLLPNALGKQQAKQAGAFEAWLVDRDGNITEGTSSNAWIVTKSGELVTRQADRGILNGVTRTGLLELISVSNLRLKQRPFSVAEAKDAAEAFLTSASSFLIPIVRIDDAAIGDGTPGPIARRLAEAYAAYATAGGRES